MEKGNSKTVYIVYADNRKDFSAAEKYGELKDVFSSVGKAYNPDALIAQARHVLKNWKSGDWLLMVGDPTLCAICFAVALEYDPLGQVNILRWNRDSFKYVPLYCDFGYEPDEEETDNLTCL